MREKLRELGTQEARNSLWDLGWMTLPVWTSVFSSAGAGVRLSFPEVISSFSLW